MKILDIRDKCTGCGACVSVCPKDSLQLLPDEDGFYYPQYQADNCISCNLCDKVCHIISPLNSKEHSEDNYYMYMSHDDSVRESSSSGGAFTVLADFVLKRGGIVFGSWYNAEKERLEFTSSDDTPLALIKKSKYVESFINNIYPMVLFNLKQGRDVLFCGTPCQINGLIRFLSIRKADCEKLITVDFLCHGVPTNKHLTEFKRSFERKGLKVINIDFRYKDFSFNGHGWRNKPMCMYFSNGSRKIIRQKSAYYYLYYQSFMDDYNLRFNCYRCQYPEHSSADITLADFWGVKKYKSDVDNNRGISIVKFNTERGLLMLSMFEICGTMEILPYDAVKYAYVLKKDREKYLPKRNAFMAVGRKRGYLKAAKKVFGKDILYESTIGSLKTIIKQILKRKQSS